MPKILFENQGGVGYITMNRPDAMNALNEALLGELLEVLRHCEGNQDVRVVVLKGNGRAFCAGGDVRWMLASQTDPAWPAGIHALGGQLNQVIMLLRNLTQPTLASVHGFAIGAGFSLALACDLRLAAAGTKFIQAYANVGLSPDGGSTYFLTKLVGSAKALELIYSGRTVEAKEALALGLLNEVTAAEDLAEKTAQLAGRMAKGPAVAYSQAKKLVYEAHQRDLAELLALEQEAIVTTTLSRDFREGLAAIAAKRKPVFEGR
ncbi:MAG: enoyl-CoA hydratase-related protein [Firmicutes bacterium]|nr:enoyl-CoA hydratase-related protein [Bacillota bacterium]